MRIRITFAKTEAMRFTSHLDLHRAWERLMRRAGLPLAYSQGFNPHPHLNLASALPHGFTGDREVIDAWLENEIAVSEIEPALNHAAPPGIQIRQVEPIELKAPTLQTQLEASDYQITFLDETPDLEAQLTQFIASPSLVRQWRGKEYDLKPMVLELELLPRDENGHQRIYTRLVAQASATGRPEEVIASLGIAPESARVHRTGIIFH
jgi:radical SAM-linked protein